MELVITIQTVEPGEPNYNYLTQPAYSVQMKNEETGEIREIFRYSLESAFRTLGNSLDRDFRNA